MKIGFISSMAPYNKKSWSGTIYSLYHILQKNHEIEWIRVDVNNNLKRLININTILQSRLLKKQYETSHTLRYSKYLSKRLNKIINNKKFDILFAPAASTNIAFIKTNIPIIYLSDATFTALIGYYSDFTNVLRKNIAEGSLIEERALSNASKIILSSEWAANSVKKYYGIDDKKVFVIPFGANLDRVPSYEEISNYDFSKPIKLLFVGNQWERKGGDIAVDAFNELKKMGINVKLTIVGCSPDISFEDLEIIPFLNKNNADDFNKFYNLFKESTFFIMPTRAECFGIVFCEASAFGLPIIASNTGGVPAAVYEGVNGVLLPLKAKGIDYANKILEIYNNKEEYLRYRRQSRLKYVKELNWDSWLEKFNEIISEYEPK